MLSTRASGSGAPRLRHHRHLISTYTSHTGPPGPLSFVCSASAAAAVGTACLAVCHRPTASTKPMRNRPHRLLGRAPVLVVPLEPERTAPVRHAIWQGDRLRTGAAAATRPPPQQAPRGPPQPLGVELELGWAQGREARGTIALEGPMGVLQSPCKQRQGLPRARCAPRCRHRRQHHPAPSC